ncbi:MAG: hypothetical protein JWM27_4372 [Gemmatimonadetes bacterium]|nr:hypothetical protein [Gemmatimonadota bacterium]
MAHGVAPIQQTLAANLQPDDEPLSSVAITSASGGIHVATRPSARPSCIVIRPRRTLWTRLARLLRR